ncbi:DUF4129 domain-containing transglutaminase family protein [Bacillus massiliglaciei]|uniref:DUF4129 domain-containing transglutaminase family protein n=1 Tax=Bacillus massiliglaciei TaxID=1816693 RepID=UPI000ABC23DF|nr:transglutaminase domain-containing protein [Bacillus massiliglaciei]
MKTEKGLELAIHIILYGFGILLITEWLRPVNELTDTHNISVFVVFVVLSLVLHYFGVHWVLRFVILNLYLMLSIQLLYSNTPLFALSWIGDYFQHVFENFGLIWNGGLSEISNSFRTFLFFVLLWLVTYLIHYWVMVKRSIFFFFLLTVLFLATLDTFTPYDAEMPILRLVLVGFGVLGLLTMLRLSIREQLPLSGKMMRKWGIPLGVMLCVSILIGFSGPKLDAQWADPVPFITTYSDKFTGKEGGGEGVNRVGYGEDDSRLGGSIEPDDSVVFYSNSVTGHYWKVESKNIYTGKGWESKGIQDFYYFNEGEDLSGTAGYQIPEGVRIEEMEADLVIEERHDHVPYPASGYVKKVEGGQVYRYNRDIEKITIQGENGRPMLPDSLSLEYSLPSFDIAKLREADGPDGNMQELMASNTELPLTVTDRTKQLAAELTEGKDNWYDQAKAIENYLHGPDFIYSKSDITYPRENQDYVDQFLFETQMGYCDNFSTSMVVMLRSIGIPARWVKGYTEGEKTLYKGKSVYEVTNNQAHSWAEAYFPGVGWVPFEPTKGFSGQAEFYNSDLNTDGAAAEEREASPAAEPEEEKPAAEKKAEEQKKLDEQSGAASNESDSGSVWTGILIAAAAVLVLAVLLYLSRRKWLPRFWIAQVKKNHSYEFNSAFSLLLKQLERAGLKRPKGQTLREYAKYVDEIYGTVEMREITSYYEKVIYRGEEETSWDELREPWETIMRKTAA